MEWLNNLNPQVWPAWCQLLLLLAMYLGGGTFPIPVKTLRQKIGRALLFGEKPATKSKRGK